MEGEGVKILSASEIENFLSLPNLLSNDVTGAAIGPPLPVSFCLPAPVLSYTWAPGVPTWISLESRVAWKCAQLFDVKWMVVTGKIPMRRLTANVKYDVTWVVDYTGLPKKKILLSIQLPHGPNSEVVRTLTAGKQAVSAGHFKITDKDKDASTATNEEGDVIFSLTNISGIESGEMIIIGVVIQRAKATTA